MTRKITLVAVVAMLALGTSAVMALGTSSHVTSDAAAEIAQETTTAPEGTANVTFENQTSNGTAVVVQRVVVPEGGFVVIHNATNVSEQTAEQETEFEGVTRTETTVSEARGQGYAAGEVLGNSTYLEPGVHEDVTVTLNETLEENQVLIAMLHRDTNDDQQYDFPEADDPYTEDDRPVTDWAFVTVEETANETTAAGAETTTEEL
jgi:hypothetical protein